MTWILVFIAMLITDVCWTFAIRRIKEGNALKAAMWNGFLMFTSAFATVSYVTNIWLLVPTIAGAMVGTYIAVKWDTRYNIS